MGLAVTSAPADGVISGAGRAYPAGRLPFAVRHPVLFVVASFAACVAWLITMTFLITHL
jgi:hypothetical protein